MKKIFYLFIVAGTFAFVACRPSAKEKEAAQHNKDSLKMDSIQKVEVAKEMWLKDSIAKVEAAAKEKEQTRLKGIKANSISITDGGKGENLYGSFSVSMTVMMGGPGGPEMMGPNKVYIFRNLPFDANTAQKLGIKAGAAYLWEDNKFKYIRDIDMNLKDNDLCRQFGVSSKDSYHRTFWTAPKSKTKK